MSGIIEQSPGDEVNWLIDWSTPLGTDTIDTSTWSVSNAAVTLSNAIINAAKTKTTITVTGGIPNTTYYITNDIVTAGGQNMSRTVPYLCIPPLLV